MYIVRYELFEDALRIYRDEVDNLQVREPHGTRSFHHSHAILLYRRSVDITASTFTTSIDTARRRWVSMRQGMLPHRDSVMLTCLALHLAFVLASQLDRAMAAYERSHQWRELFALAVSQKIGVSEMEDMCTRVAGAYLSSRRKKYSTNNTLWTIRIPDVFRQVPRGCASVPGLPPKRWTERSRRCRAHLVSRF